MDSGKDVYRDLRGIVGVGSGVNPDHRGKVPGRPTVVRSTRSLKKWEEQREAEKLRIQRKRMAELLRREKAQQRSSGAN